MDKSKNGGIMIVSIPKSGTHLLERALCLKPEIYRSFYKTLNGGNIDMVYGGLKKVVSKIKGNQLLVSHLYYSEDAYEALMKKNIKILFIYRNPKDVIISNAYYLADKSTHRLNETFKKLEMKDRIKLLIEGNENMKGVAWHYNKFLGWKDKPSVLSIKYEDLIGEKGGGSREKQEKILRDIFDHLEYPLSIDEFNSIVEGVFSNKSPTFRSGKNKQWETYFDDEIRERYQNKVHNVEQKYGY
jgi:hypothetical protein